MLTSVAIRPTQCFQQGLQGLSIEHNASHSPHHFQESIITTFYIINIIFNATLPLRKIPPNVHEW
jgi:hypothetical protein